MDETAPVVITVHTPLIGLVLVLYWAAVCFFLLRLVQLALEQVISPAVAFVAAVATVSICLLFSLVNLPLIPWWGQDDRTLKAASWAGMGLLLAVSIAIRLVRGVASGTVRRHSRQKLIERAARDIATNPTNPAPHLKLAEMYEEQGNYAAALKEVQKALDKSPSAALRARLNRLHARVR